MIEKELLEVPQEPWLLYDGDCPFCSHYVKLVRLRQSLPALRLVNARSGSLELDYVRSVGLIIDEGMILAMDGQLYHGHQCIHMLALMSTSNDHFNRLNCWIFASSARSKLLYPLLRAGRNAVLYFLNRSRIGNG